MTGCCPCGSCALRKNSARHVSMLPQALGPRAREAGVAVVPWLWEHTPALRLVCHISAANTLAIRYAERMGLEQYGLNPKSWMKDGKLHDEVLLGISKD